MQKKTESEKKRKAFVELKERTGQSALHFRE